MANTCFFDGLIIADKPESIVKFRQWLTSHYDYSLPEVTATIEHHFWRVRESYMSDISKNKDGKYEMTFNGDCAWSCASTMCVESTSDRYVPNSKGISMREASELLNCDIEVYSNECGMCFAEHYIWSKGEMRMGDCVDYYETYIADFDTYQQYLKENEDFADEYCPLLSQEEFEELKSKREDYKAYCDYDFDNLDFWIRQENSY